MLNTDRIDMARHLLPPPGAQAVKECLNEIDKLRDALIWCSGSDDFGQWGKAHKGWNKICKPLLLQGGYDEETKTTTKM